MDLYVLGFSFVDLPVFELFWIQETIRKKQYLWQAVRQMKCKYNQMQMCNLTFWFRFIYIKFISFSYIKFSK